MVEKEASTLMHGISDKYGLDLNFNEIKEKVFSQGTEAIKQFFILFKGLSNGFIYFIFALVINFLLFFEKELIRSTLTAKKGSLLEYLYNFIEKRVSDFYRYFKMVMGGQVIISLINTVFTTIIIFIFHLPNKISLISLVFLFGLLPIIGNVISNTILSVTALVSDGVIACLICLAFLISVHKLEYFLNSKIIGSIVKLPMFLMLLSLLLFEAMLGIWGLIIAIPAVLFLKKEMENLQTA
jgi:predicted PurR-regulated permease PerM